MPETAATRDFSSAAVWRGSIAAIVAGNIASAIAMTTLEAAFQGFRVDLLHVLDILAYQFEKLLNPLFLVAVFIVSAAILMVGYFVLGAYRGDFTTYRAAAVIGARTAAIIAAFPFFLFILASIGDFILHGPPDLDVAANVLKWLLASGALILAAGAVTGLAARAAAGAPRETAPAPEQPA